MRSLKLKSFIRSKDPSVGLDISDIWKLQNPRPEDFHCFDSYQLSNRSDLETSLYP